jgi:hypothetical protein
VTGSGPAAAPSGGLEVKSIPGIAVVRFWSSPIENAEKRYHQSSKKVKYSDD